MGCIWIRQETFSTFDSPFLRNLYWILETGLPLLGHRARVAELRRAADEAYEATYELQA